MRLGPVAVEWPVVLGVLACVVASASYGFGAILMKRHPHDPLPASAAVHVAGAMMPAAGRRHGAGGGTAPRTP